MFTFISTQYLGNLSKDARKMRFNYRPIILTVRVIKWSRPGHLLLVNRNWWFEMIYKQKVLKRDTYFFFRFKQNNIGILPCRYIVHIPTDNFLQVEQKS